MKVKFLRDFRGVLTKEVFYLAGQIADLDSGQALIAAGVAEEASGEATKLIGLDALVVEPELGEISHKKGKNVKAE